MRRPGRSNPAIVIRGARTHNLKNVSLALPRNRLIVVTGASGSGKSSLVFDTLYAEAQRRYVQSLSTYARLFVERLERPDVESISLLPPALALQQKNVITSARATVGSVTEISDYLRLLFAAAGQTVCPDCRREVGRDTIEKAAAQMLEQPGFYLVLAPFDPGGRSLAAACSLLAGQGYHRLFLGGAVTATTEVAERPPATAPGATLEVVVDRVVTSTAEAPGRLREALERAFYLSGGRAKALRVERHGQELKVLQQSVFNQRFNCPQCERNFVEPTPALFSPHSPVGACPRCQGFGRVIELDLDRVMPDTSRALRDGLVVPWQTPAYRPMQRWMLACARRGAIRTGVPYRDLSAREKVWVVEGERDGGAEREREERWPGIRGFFRWLEAKRYKTHVRVMLARYRRFVECPDCGASKVKPEALYVRLGHLNIAEVERLSVDAALAWVEAVARRPEVRARCAAVVRELRNRLGYLVEVGLGYLTLARQARTLSGGETQRIHLGRALGTALVASLYVLDEPTVGLHACEVRSLLKVLRHLCKLGNTVVVVEHDPVLIAGADYVVELGPGGGARGGEVIYAGPASRTAARRSGPGRAGRVRLMQALSREDRAGPRRGELKVAAARQHNLKNLNLLIPLQRLVCITGVSGSGKSTLMRDVLYNSYLRRLGVPGVEPVQCDRIEGLEQVREMVYLAQALPARSARSNPVTYMHAYDGIRKALAAVPAAGRLGLKPGHFSFNVPGGRCESCRGQGTVSVEMHFMADVEVRCPVCDGRRFKPKVLQAALRGKNLLDLLEMTVEDAAAFFHARPEVASRLEPLVAVGLGYLKLGQPTSTLSAGEAQRLKLARLLLKEPQPRARQADHGLQPRAMPAPSPGQGGGQVQAQTRVFLLDEPTTGLGAADIARLLQVLDRLLAEGNSIIAIEHNVAFIAHAHHVIDLGPGAGARGGEMLAAGTPAQVASCRASYTGGELRRYFGIRPPAPTGRGQAAALSDASGQALGRLPHAAAGG